MKRPIKLRSSPFKIIVACFLLLILAGTLLLMLPISSKEHGGTSFGDSLFTATSAACVTGLIVKDTATYWSGFGQAVILVLIQVGGVGVVTVAVFIASIARKKLDLVYLGTMQESISAPKMGGIIGLTKFLLKITLAVELSGAVLLSTVFCKEFGFWKGVWYSVFHSISAFCNAGFDLMGVRSQFSSMTGFSANGIVSLSLILLIVIGGLGFATWEDIKQNKFKFRKYRLQSKLILITSAVLLLLPAVYFFFFEYAALPAGERILCSAFQSATARTAGFNTTDLAQMSQSGQSILIILMLVGGSPGSTAGGMKTTTLAVLLLSMAAVFRKKNNVECMGRRISDGAVRHAITILVMYFSLFFLSAILISNVEGLPFLPVLFETASAVGTVGLTLGITPTLGALSRAVLIFLMFFGRVGGLTLIYATLKQSSNYATLPQENVTVG